MIKDRQGNIVPGNEGQDKLLKNMYGSGVGRAVIQLLIQPPVSKMAGLLLDSKWSTPFIAPFIKNNHISMEEYVPQDYESYNDFFTRRIKEDQRNFSQGEDVLCAPCDSKVSVYSVKEGGKFLVKDTLYTMKSLLRSEKLAKKYQGGILCIFRLTVDDYHHYCYVDEGKKTKNYSIPGVFHTVNPVANDQYPIYKENAREFSILKSKHFGNVLMMEVGALMVGKIVNHHEEAVVSRGMEKGYFEFGGSTVILAFEKDKVEIDQDILQNSQEGYETVVKLGEAIGKRK